MATTRAFFQRALIGLLAALLTSSFTQPTAEAYFNGYVTWAQQCIGNPSNTACSSAATDFFDFVYAVATGADPTVGTVQLTATCRSCASALDTAFTAVLPSSDSGSCPLLPNRNESALVATALRRFSCWGTDTSGSSSSAGGAGSCVVQVASGLRAAGLLDRVMRLDPTLRFTGDVLRSACAALAPGPPAAPSCCVRSWAYLAAALAHQACAADLARELMSLPGRCELLSNRTVAGFCEADWPSFLLPLLSAPPAARCQQVAAAPSITPVSTKTSDSPSSPPPSSPSTTSYPLANTATPATQASPPPPSAPAVAPLASLWVSGAACSASQLARSRCPASTCDLWCGLVGRLQELQGAGLANLSSETGGGASAPPPPYVNSGVSSSGGGHRRLQTSTLVVVCVFSVLCAVMLAALAAWVVAMWREKQAGIREKFQFKLNFNPVATTMPPLSTSQGTYSTPPARHSLQSWSQSSNQPNHVDGNNNEITPAGARAPHNGGGGMPSSGGAGGGTDDRTAYITIAATASPAVLPHPAAAAVTVGGALAPSRLPSAATSAALSPSVSITPKYKPGRPEPSQLPPGSPPAAASLGVGAAAVGAGAGRLQAPAAVAAAEALAPSRGSLARVSSERGRLRRRLSYSGTDESAAPAAAPPPTPPNGGAINAGGGVTSPNVSPTPAPASLMLPADEAGGIGMQPPYRMGLEAPGTAAVAAVPTPFTTTATAPLVLPSIAGRVGSAGGSSSSLNRLSSGSGNSTGGASVAALGADRSQQELRRRGSRGGA
ncbi:hypothetical protein Agub_g3552 [Astrephomene gubernaculifera]|uniref:Uncharacterized protein n=1 Tax=Astrephomene gubernaculifera TaxID=47775 RepID=A0AAD3HJ93_9CHLO|nr:hypothetical protein Agub_g3552 [Astrephomene gubernaculifera]